MHTVNLLTSLVENYQILVYLLIFLGLIIEGELILISTGILIHLNALDPFLTFVFITLGLMCKTFLGYYLGQLIHDRWNKQHIMKHLEKRALHLVPHFQEKPFWSIFISKFILGVNNIVIIFSGYRKINFKKYLQAEFYSTIAWAPIMLTVGYLFSYAALSFSREVWRFTLIVIILTGLFWIFDKLVSWAYELFEEFYHDAQ